MKRNLDIIKEYNITLYFSRDIWYYQGYLKLYNYLMSIKYKNIYTVRKYLNKIYIFNYSNSISIFFETGIFLEFCFCIFFGKKIKLNFISRCCLRVCINGGWCKRFISMRRVWQAYLRSIQNAEANGILS